MKQASISDLEKGDSRSSAFLVHIANACGVSARWLATGAGEMLESGSSGTPENSTAGVATHPAMYESNVAPAPKLEGYVPIVSWVQAGCWSEMSVCDIPVDELEMVPRPPGCSPRTFALRVKGQSMLPKYDPDLIIYVDPEVLPFDGDDVIAVLTDNNEATFKQFVEEPDGRRLLKARNPSWPEPWVSINGNCEIIGVVIGSLWLRKPRTS
jgi:phage repressor protein C with HTH and peptisase S24 domain